MSAGGEHGAVPTRFDMRWRRARGTRRTGFALNITPLIDVVFLLLVYFTLISTFRAEERSIDVALPPEAAAEATGDPFALPDRPVRVRVRSLSPGAYAITVEAPEMGGEYSFEELTGALARLRAGAMGASQRFVVESAPGTRWEHTLRAVDAIRAAGFRRITFSGGAP